MLNGRECDAFKALFEASQKFNFHVNIKTPLLKTCTFYREGVWLDERSFNYSRNAELDFVIMKPFGKVDFAIEYDGPFHLSDQSTIERDLLKNAICEKFGLPLFRIYTGNIDSGLDGLIFKELVEMYYANVHSCSAGMSVRRMLSKDDFVAELVFALTGFTISQNDRRELKMETQVDAYGYTQSELKLTAGAITVPLAFGRCRVPQESLVCGKRLADMLAYRHAIRVLAPYSQSNSGLLSNCRKIIHTRKPAG